jgi:STE24 endopeptidase
MSRFLPLVIFVLWMASPTAPPPVYESHGLPINSLILGLVCYLGFYALLIGVMGLWSRHVARRVHYGDIQHRLRRFNFVMYIARLMVPAWFGVGIFLLGWKQLVNIGFTHTPIANLDMDVPGLLVGSLPAFLAWMGLWWSQYPADYALREQNLLIQLNDSLPVHAPPNFWVYFSVNFRLQILFTVAPVLALMLLRDILGIALPPVFHHIPWLRDQQSLIEACISIPSAVTILLLGPELLRRVLDTEPMPDSPLRRRLQEVCRQNNVGFRDVLIWHTRHQMGNAAVMGFIARFRYFLLSDLLLETMSDEQIEAVFAHEIGHIMHRHLIWLMALVAGIMLAFSGPGAMLADSLDQLHHHIWFPETLELILLTAGGLGLFALVFGYVSRKLERQADVFAARILQKEHDALVSQAVQEANRAAGRTGDAANTTISPAIISIPNIGTGEIVPGGTTGAVATAVFPRIAEAPLPPEGGKTYVGRYGAHIFCSALERVATVNNIPIAARSWCHGSIAKRIGFLKALGRDPSRTRRFDRFMSRLYLTLILLLCICGAWTMASWWRAGFSAPDTSTAAAVQLR